ncbi:MAG: NUDIX domain-containing protein [Dehalococcoidia bacterium]|jgi:ADP-ribose pyrophosphatase YjhB (NUDIX family)|nr:NUDIX domain-containing protein [Dehalococcoidia bacterium]
MAEHAAPRDPRLRVIAIATIIHRDHVLLVEGHDSVKQETFYRALGGEVEFGETAEAAVARELIEETGRRIEVTERLGVIENLYTFEGQPGHEVVFEFVARFVPGEEPDDLSPIEADEGGAKFVVRWLPLAEVLAGTHRVYPDGIEQRLAEWVNRL